MAIQCLSEAYGVDLSSASQRAKYDVEPTLEVRLKEGRGEEGGMKGRKGKDKDESQRFKTEG